MISALSRPALSSDGAKGKKFVLIVADHIGFLEWSDPRMKTLREIEPQGAIGLMVTKTETTSVRSNISELENAAYMTIGSGVPARGDDDGRLAFNTNELVEDRTAGLVYSLVTGYGNPAAGMIVHLGIGSQSDLNAETSYKARPGELGAILKKGGVRTAAIGNSDWFERSERGASMIAMDASGTVPFGDVSLDLVTKDPTAPLGFKTNIEMLKNRFKEYLGKSDFIVIDYGDTSRINRFRTMATAEAHAAAKLRTLKEFTRFLSWIMKNIDPATTQLIVVSPTPPAGAVLTKDTLTPVFAYGAGITPGALISSQSTKQAGLFRNADISAHICAFFGLEPGSDFIGQPLETTKNAAPLDFLREYHRRDILFESQIGLLRGIVIWELVLLLICFVVSLRAVDTPKWLRQILTGVLLWSASMFLSFLLIAGIPQLKGEFDYITVFFGLAAVVAILISFIPGYDWKMIALSGLYLVSIVADQLTGGSLIKLSVLGYFPQGAARFYGLGNEFMGFMIGAPLVIYGLLMDLRPGLKKGLKISMPFVFTASAVMVGIPAIGANFGGLIACLFGYVFMGVLLLQGKLKWKTALAAAAAVVVLVAAFVAVDVTILGGHSHIGQLVWRISHGGGLDELTKVVGRKLEINFRLLRVSFWSALFLISLAVALIMHYFPMDLVSRLLKKYGEFRKAYLACVVGAIAALLFNDSGIVPAATALVLPTATVFLLLFNSPLLEKKKRQYKPAWKENRREQQTDKPPKKEEPAAQSRSILLKNVPSQKKQPQDGPERGKDRGSSHGREQGRDNASRSSDHGERRPSSQHGHQGKKYDEKRQTAPGAPRQNPPKQGGQSDQPGAQGGEFKPKRKKKRYYGPNRPPGRPRPDGAPPKSGPSS